MAQLVKEQLFQELSDAVVDMDEERVVAVAKTIVKHGLDAYEAIDKGLSNGMYRAGKLFEEEEYFVPELLICSDAMYAGLNILKPHIKARAEGPAYRVVLGVIEGDTHDIGKNLVKTMLETSGFEVIDLGRDIPPEQFVAEARDSHADLIGISTLMTTTMDGIGEIIKRLERENIRNNFKVMVGGGPVSQSFADRIGADGYADNAAEAVKLARRLVGGAV